MLQYRQGDVLLEKVDAKPGNAHKKTARDKLGRIVLAEGELTGHSHVVNEKTAAFFESSRRGALQRLLVIAKGGATLKHEDEARQPTGDHGAIDLPAGTYRVIQQREYDPSEGGFRGVAD